MKKLVTQIMIGLGAALTTLGIVSELGAWAIIVGVAIYILGLWFN